MFKEDVAKTMVLIKPELVAISSVLLLRALGRARRPFASAIEEIAEESNAVGVKDLLYMRKGSAQILIDVANGERIGGPRTPRVGMRIYELRVGNEDESMWVCAAFLHQVSSTAHWESQETQEAYPILPLLPPAVTDTILYRRPLPSIHSNHPNQAQHIDQAKPALPIPATSPHTIPPLLHLGFDPEYRKRTRGPPYLVWEAFRLGICANGQAVVVVVGHRAVMG